MGRRGLAAATASSLALGVLVTASAGASTVIGPPLADPHIGVPLAAPPPPLVDGEPPDFVLYRWESCRHYWVLVDSDRPTGVWHLDHDVADGAIAYPPNGGARRFDGIDDSLPLSADPDISGTRPYTIELWVRPSFTVDGRYRFLISRERKDAQGRRQGSGIWFSRDGLGFERWSEGVKAGITFTRRIESGKWTYVVATYDGTRMRLFVSGWLIGSRATTAPLAPSSEPFVLGAGYGGRGGFFRGDLDELALYDKALTRSHVGAHGFAGQSRAPCVEIPLATGPTYTPIQEDLGHTVKVITNSTRSLPTGDVTVTSISESVNPTDDAGQLVRPLILRPLVGETVSGTTLLTAAVLGLPLDRIEFLVDGVVRYAKGEDPYQYAWDTTKAGNGVHTVAVRVWGPGSSTPVTAQRSVTVAN